MKKLVSLVLIAMGTGFAAVAQEQGNSNQSLGDVVRNQHSQNQAASSTHKVWTNDDFAEQPPTPAPAAAPAAEPAAGPTTPSTPDDAQKTVDLSTTKGKDEDKAKAKEAGNEQAKVDEEWKGKLDAQKARIQDLKREYDLTERESKLSATTYYADAGNRLRDQKDFADKEASYRDKINTLQKQISDEQAKLAEMQDQAHKAGANKAYD